MTPTAERPPASLDASDDVASALINVLASEGQAIDEGVFTLDPVKALQKLRDHQLANPLAYLLLLVEAAHLASAAQGLIHIELGATTTAHFMGTSLPDDELRNPLAAVFRGGKGLDGEALMRSRLVQLLGLAANGALAAGAKQVIIENTDAKGRLRRVTLTPAGEPSFEQLDPRGPARPSHTLFRYVGGSLELRRRSRELELLWAHCQFSSMPIFVNGKRLNEGLQAAFEAFGGVETTPITLDELGLIGQAALLGNTEPARALILTRSVLAEALTLPDCRPGFLAVVDADLRKDLSQRQLLRDPMFEAVLDAIGRAHERLQSPAISSQAPLDDDGSPVWLVVVLIMLVVPLLWLLASTRDSVSCGVDAPADVSEPSVEPAQKL